MALRSKQSSRRAVSSPDLFVGRAWLQQLYHWPHRSLGARLQLSHLITSLVPLLAVGAVLLYASTQAERRTVEQIQLSVARSLAADLSDRLLQAEYNLVDFGLSVPFDAPPEAIRDAAKMFVDRHSPDVVDLSILNLQGNEVAHVTYPPVPGATFYRNRSNEPFFSSVKQGWIERNIVKTATGRYLLQLAVPTKNKGGRITGVLIAQMSTQRLEQRLMALPENTGRNAFLVDDTGKVLLGYPPHLFATANSLKQWLAESSSLQSLPDGGGNMITVARAQVQPPAWSVIVEQPTDIALNAQRRNTWLLGIMLMFTAIMVVFWGLIIGRQMTRPILRLRDGVRTLAGGHLGDTIVVDRDDELGDLAQEFNRMSERLAEQQQAIERRNRRLAESQQAIEAHNAQLREGLELARLVQRDLLPQAPPSNTAVRAAAASESAIEIGGDFYTYVPLPDGRLRLIIGDASGQGVAAALVMALASSLVEVHAREAASPSALLNRLNAELCPRFTANHMCVALLVAEFNPHTDQLCVANAGMIAPLVTGRGACTYIDCFGLPLGAVPKAQYSEATITLAPDQAVIFISDGIVEARNAARAMWGFQRFEETVCGAPSDDPQAIVATVLQELKRHTGTNAPADDLTIIATNLVSAQIYHHEAELMALAQLQAGR